MPLRVPTAVKLAAPAALSLPFGLHVFEEQERLDLQLVGNLLDRLQAEIPLAALDSGPLGLVKSDALGKHLLTRFFRFPEVAEVPRKCSLKVPCHRRNRLHR